MVRTNMRRRGPIESQKLNRNNQDLVYNITYLCEQLNLLKANLNSLEASIYDRSNLISSKLKIIKTIGGELMNV